MANAVVEQLLDDASKAVQKQRDEEQRQRARRKTTKELKAERNALDIAFPVAEGTEITLGRGAVQKLRAYEKLRVKLDAVESDIEAIKLWFAKKGGTAEVIRIADTGKAVIRKMVHKDAYEVDEQDYRECTFRKAPPAKA